MGVLGWVLVGVFVAAWVSGVAGYVLTKDNPRANSNDLGKDKCAQCKLDKAWYDAQPWYVQAAVVVWWLGNRTACVMNGC